MKRGLNTHLAVCCEIDFEDVKTIEFVFSNSIGSDIFKKEVYPDTVNRVKDTNIILIPFSSEETYKISDVFYLDTRITLKSTEDQPETSILQLEINNTLFEEVL